MTLENNNVYTTIQISKEVHKFLQKKKVVNRESYNDVIKRLIEEHKEEIQAKYQREKKVAQMKLKKERELKNLEHDELKKRIGGL